MIGKFIRFFTALMALTLVCSLFSACGSSIPDYVPSYGMYETDDAVLSTSEIESLLEDESETNGSDIVKVETKTTSNGSVQVIIEKEDGTIETQTYATKERYEQAVKDGNVTSLLSGADSKVSTKEPTKEESSFDTKSSKKDTDKESSSEPESSKQEKEGSSAAPQTSAPEPSKTPEQSSEPATQQPTTQVPETQVPTTQVPETQPPETTAAPHVHSYTSKVTKQPTCQETGVKTYMCFCGDSYTETIPVTDHHYVEKKEESVVTVMDSEEFTVNVGCCIPRYFVSYSQFEDGSWDFLGTWQDTIQYGVPQTEWFYDIPENYVMDNGHNSNELIAYMRNAGYRYIYTVNDQDGDASDACDRWLRCIGEFSDGPKNPDHGFREHYGPSWWCDITEITVPAVTHQETVTNTYYECSECGQRK